MPIAVVGGAGELAVLRAAHAELPAPADFTAVRFRVMAELERRAQPWRRLAWISGPAAAAVLLMFALWPARVVPEAPRLLARIPPGAGGSRRPFAGSPTLRT